MKRRYAIVALLLLTFGLCLSCRNFEDVAARYVLEQKLWNAQTHERKININFLRASQKDLHLAIEAFNEVVAANPLAGRPIAQWDEAVVQDIQRIMIVSKIALANLYFLSERYHDAANFYDRTLEESDLAFDRRLDVRLNLARTLYLAGEARALETNCSQIFKEITESEYFWAGRSPLKDVFLNIPLVLARVYRDRGDRERFDEYSGVARDFYSKIMNTWPDSVISARARFSMVNLYLLREEWPSALGEIDGLINHPNFVERSGSLLLLKGEILAFAMNRTAMGKTVFLEIVRDYPGNPTAHAAALDLATLALESGDQENGIRMLKEIESDESVSPETAAKAMLARALYLEGKDRWDEAIAVLRRIIRIHPHTSAAVESPLVITRHYVAKEDARLAEISLDRAKEFYFSLIARGSKYAGDRLEIEDFLIENYLLMGRAAEVASLLETESSKWDEISTAGGLFKSALVYAEILEDKDSAVRILKKCIELFPETRYAKIAQRQLEQLAED